MSCPNFSKVNADRYYVITSQYEDGTPRDYDLEVEHIIDFLEEKGWSPDDSWNSIIESRNIATKTDWVSPYKTKTSIFDLKIEVSLTAINGHYSGINLDYDIVITTDTGGDSWNLSQYNAAVLIDCIIESYKENVDYWGDTEHWNIGTFALQEKYLRKWLINTLRRFCALGEWACAVNCNEVLNLVNVFSNGEGIYEKMDGEKENILIRELKEVIKD